MVHNKREFVMKGGARMRLAVLLGLVALAAQSAGAGSAVAWDGHGHLVSYHGYPVDEAKRLALDTARSRYGNKVKLVAYCDVTGYGAIAVGRNEHGSGSVVGVTLGRESALEAQNLAMENCLNAGGINPKVIRTFKG
jgi:hypothetical protein